MSQQDDPRPSLPPFSALRAFEAVGRLGGIRRAALDLGLDHAVVSRHLRALEDWGGVPLINRQREGRVLTDAGLRFHQRVTLALQEIANASAELRVIRGSQSLRIWCMPGFALEWLTARLPHFQSLHPDIELSVRPSDRSPDFSTYEAEVDIRYVAGDEPVDPGVVTGTARRVELARPFVFPVASPAAIASIPPIHHVADLLRVPLLHEDSDLQWRNWFAAHDVPCPAHLPGPRLWHAHLTIESARRGHGVALANPYLIGNDIETGRLHRVDAGDPDIRISLGAYVFAARADRWNAKAIADFRRWLRCEMSPQGEAATAAPVALRLSLRGA